MKVCGIYIIKNNKNKKVYIGQSTNVLKRISDHKYLLNMYSHHNKHIQRAYNKYKEFFSFELLEECKKEELDEKEIYWINKFNSFKKGYNQTEGGKPNILTCVKGKKTECIICGKETHVKLSKYCKEHSRKCRTCNNRISKTMSFCDDCFEKRNPLKFTKCEECGKKIKKNSNRQRVCHNCKKELTRKRVEKFRNNKKKPC